MLEQLSAGCVLTGGAVLMEGMVECAEEILGMPVRLGFPVGVKGIIQLVQGPQYATGVGLVRYGAQQLARGSAAHGERRSGASQRSRAAAAACEERILEWLRAASRRSSEDDLRSLRFTSDRAS